MGRLGNLLLGVAVICWQGCAEDSCREVPATELSQQVQIERLDQKLFGLDDQEEVTQLLQTNPGFSKYFLDTDQYPSDQIVARKLVGLINDPYIDTLYRETQEKYEDIDWLAQELQNIHG